MLAYIDRFHQHAIKHNLSAAAILLWQVLYFRMVSENQFARLQQDTAALMQLLQITRQGLIGVRKSLERAGLLAVEQDESQKLWYTLQLDGQPLQPVAQQAGKAAEESGHEGAEPAMEQVAAPQSDAAVTADSRQQAEREADATAYNAVHDEQTNSQTILPMQPVVRKNLLSAGNDGTAAAALQVEMQKAKSLALQNSIASERGTSVQPIHFADKPAPAGDIVMGRAYSVYIKAFCSRYDDSSLQSSLTSWLQQREQNGWTLTLWGLEELLRKLVQLAAGQAETMVAIVKQSIKRRWKGFHALKVQSRPCGEKLLQLEEKERRAYEKAHPKQPAIVRKLFGMGEASDEDLSFLEE